MLRNFGSMVRDLASLWFFPFTLHSGVQFYEGQLDETEKVAIKNALHRYQEVCSVYLCFTHLNSCQQTQQLDDNEMEDLMFVKKTKDAKRRGFWTQIGTLPCKTKHILAKLMMLSAQAVPGRRVRTVYDHVSRSRHPLCKQGPWTKGDDAQLKMCVYVFSVKLHH